MCLCLEIVWSSLKSWCCCECIFKRDEDSDNERKKRKEKKKSRQKMRSGDSSKDSSKESTKEGTKDTPKPKVVGQLKTVSEVSEIELLDKYMIQLPKDGCDSPDQWLRTKGYLITDSTLGSGGYGRVFKAVKLDSTGNKCEIAVKIIDLDPSARKHKRNVDALKNELFVTDALIQQINKVKHNHIITIFDRFIIENNEKDVNKKVSKAYFFMELGIGDMAHELLAKGPLPPTPLAKRYFAQIVYALEYMHRLNIAHRDLKLENFLLVKSLSLPLEKDVKVTDFGLSRVQYKEETGPIYTGKTGGTLYYKSPEILKLQIPVSGKLYDAFKADIWALGVCLYRMLTTKYPFDMMDIKKTVESMEKKEICLTFPRDPKIVIDKVAEDLILRMLEPDPDKRPKIADVKAHKWLEGENTITQSVTPSATQ